MRERSRNLLFTFLKMLSSFLDRAAFDQNIFATEFILRIASFRRIPVCLHAIMKIENLRGITERCVDLFFRPDVEYALFCFDMAPISARGYNGAVGVFGGEEPAFFRRHVASDVVENVTRNCFVLLIFC